MASQRPRNGVRVPFAARLTIQFATNHSCKQRVQICSPSCMRTETALPIICDDSTTWLLISAGSHGPSSPNEHGPKSEVKLRERSRPKNTEPSSLRKRIAERRAYYDLLYETGAAQTDAANLTAENIDWKNGILVYHRK